MNFLADLHQIHTKFKTERIALIELLDETQRIAERYNERYKDWKNSNDVNVFSNWFSWILVESFGYHQSSGLPNSDLYLPSYRLVTAATKERLYKPITPLGKIVSDVLGDRIVTFPLRIVSPLVNVVNFEGYFPENLKRLGIINRLEIQNAVYQGFWYLFEQYVQYFTLYLRENQEMQNDGGNTFVNCKFVTNTSQDKLIYTEDGNIDAA